MSPTPWLGLFVTALVFFAIGKTIGDLTHRDNRPFTNEEAKQGCIALLVWLAILVAFVWFGVFNPIFHH